MELAKLFNFGILSVHERSDLKLFLDEVFFTLQSITIDHETGVGNYLYEIQSVRFFFLFLHSSANKMERTELFSPGKARFSHVFRGGRGVYRSLPRESTFPLLSRPQISRYLYSQPPTRTWTTFDKLPDIFDLQGVPLAYLSRLIYFSQPSFNPSWIYCSSVKFFVPATEFSKRKIRNERKILVTIDTYIA